MQNASQSELLLQIQQRIKTAVPYIRHIEEDLGQLEDYKTKPEVSWPCALISTEIAQANDMGDLAQMVDGMVIIRLALPPYSSGAAWFDQATKEKALRIYDIEWQVYKALHGWQPTNFSSLSFRTATNERRNDAIRVREMRFEAQWEEYSAQAANPHTTTLLPGQEFTGQALT